MTHATAALGDRSSLVGFIDFANPGRLSTTKQRAVVRDSGIETSESPSGYGLLEHQGKGKFKPLGSDMLQRVATAPMRITLVCASSRVAQDEHQGT